MKRVQTSGTTFPISFLVLLEIIPFGTGTDGYGAASNPATIKGKGKGGAIDVDMSDEDIQYLRDVAQRDYVAKISTNTLAPNIKLTLQALLQKRLM